MSQTPTRVAFFGGTGGSPFAALVRAISAGTHINALCRTPSKLEGKLKERGIDESTMRQYLSIIPGNIKDIQAVRTTLLDPMSSESSPRLVDKVISAVGATEVTFTWNPLKPVGIPDKWICADATKTIFAALRQIQDEQARATSAAAVQRPLLLAISTTGLSKRQRDVPMLFVPLYHWLLAAPHEDKRAMEENVVDTVTESGGQGPVRGFVIVRPSLFLDGEASDNLRVGWEWGPKARLEGLEKAPGPAIGYTVTRESVGNWIFKEVIQGQNDEKWMGKMVSLTH
ncbi:MAG: hypothetical protein M1831_003195 [Alyxoria varia]|nr:MAG: hypothetical protein M1831_003195 [Alyxoria varia]